MIEGLLGKKLGMSRIFSSDGKALAVTLIECGPCYVSAVSDNGSIQLGYEEVKEKSLSKAEVGHLKKSKLPLLRNLKEVKWQGSEDDMPAVGDVLKADSFSEGEFVNVQGVSRGKGFAGVVKRWGFGGGRKTHGGRALRGPGAIGAGSDPGRIWPGKKMAGRMGGEKVTAENLEVIKVDFAENIIAVKGSVPGPTKSVLFISRSQKVKVK